MAETPRPRSLGPAARGRANGNRRVVAVLVVGVGVLAVAAVVSRAIDRREASAAEVAEAFIAAREEGDCERLAGMLSRDSWSDGGELTRQQFLEACPRAVDGYKPLGIEQITLSADDVQVTGDVAAVELSTTGAEGRLVREDGEWKVVAGALFRLGRTPGQAVLGYVEAYGDGDCERLVDFVSEATWSAGGGSRDDYVDRCATSMPEEGSVAVTNPTFGEYDDPADATDEATVEIESYVTYPEVGRYSFREEVALVEEQFEWKLGTTDGGGEPFDTIAGGRLAVALVDELPVPSSTIELLEVNDLRGATSEDENWYGGLDAEQALRDAGFVSNAWTTFDASRSEEGVSITTGANITLWQFDSPEGARSYADRLAGLILADQQRSGDGQEAAVPGFDDAHGVVNPQNFGIDDTYITAVHDDVVIGVYYVEFEGSVSTSEDDDDLSRAAEILQAQIDDLDATLPPGP